MNRELDMVARMYQNGRITHDLQNQVSDLVRQNILLQEHNQKLQEKLSAQEQINAARREKELHSIIRKKDEELHNAQEYIVELGKIVLKNAEDIRKLVKRKSNEDLLARQVSELIDEKNFLWEIVLTAHQSITQQPVQEYDSKYDKAYELMDLIRQQYGDYNPPKRRSKP